MNVRKKLLELKEDKYQKFHTSLVPGIDNVLGVRVPQVRKIAEELAKTDYWQDYKDDLYYEEVMIQGLLIGYAKMDNKKRLELLKSFIPKINNWGICDVVCSNLKFTKKCKEHVWHFLQPYLKSNQEFEIRFGVVMLLDYFIDDEYIDKVLDVLDKIRHEGYYAKMAIAWALSVCFVKYWDKTLKYFLHSNLSDWVFNKTVQKVCESYRISNENKVFLKQIKRHFYKQKL